MFVVADRRNGLVQYLKKTIIAGVHLQHHIHRIVIEQIRQADAVYHGRLQVIRNHRHRCQKCIGLARENLPHGFADTGDRHRCERLHPVEHGVLIRVAVDDSNPAALQIRQSSDGGVAGTDKQTVGQGHQRVGEPFPRHHWHARHPGGQNGIGLGLALNRATVFLRRKDHGLDGHIQLFR